MNRVISKTSAMGAAFEPLEPRQLFSTSGMEFLALSSTTPNAKGVVPDNPGTVASLIAKSGNKAPVIGFAPFVFNPNHPYANATALVQDALPKLAGGTLTLDIYLQWQPHDVPGSIAQDEFWAACTSPAAVPSGFVSKVHTTDNWANSMLAWAHNAGFSSTALKFAVIPWLEQDTRSLSEYTNVITRMRQQQAADSISMAIRQSAEPGYEFHLANTTVEIHGTLAEALPHLRAGDTWSSDGASESYITGGQFLADEKQALREGVNVLLWDVSYNGQNPTRDNETSRFVNPFSSAVIKTLSLSALEQS
jgi:hypothetical protein